MTTDSNATPAALKWAVTANNPRQERRYDGNTTYPRSGWKQHAIDVEPGVSIFDEPTPSALCGLRPKSGWGVDLYEDDMDECARCDAILARREAAQP